jgi:hypothetical protein
MDGNASRLLGSAELGAFFLGNLKVGRLGQDDSQDILGAWFCLRVTKPWVVAFQVHICHSVSQLFLIVDTSKRIKNLPELLGEETVPTLRIIV